MVSQMDVSLSVTFLPLWYFQSGTLSVSGHSKIRAEVDPEFRLHCGRTVCVIQDSPALGASVSCCPPGGLHCDQPESWVLGRAEQAMHLLVSLNSAARSCVESPPATRYQLGSEFAATELLWASFLLDEMLPIPSGRSVCSLKGINNSNNKNHQKAHIGGNPSPDFPLAQNACCRSSK